MGHATAARQGIGGLAAPRGASVRAEDEVNGPRGWHEWFADVSVLAAVSRWEGQPTAGA